MFKRKGIYYFMWSEGNWTNSSYGVSYATGSSPTGPFTAHGKILQSDPAVANGPGHHSVMCIPGTDEWYIVYHRHPLNDGDGNHRVVCIDKMQFDANDRIKNIVITNTGVDARPLTVTALQERKTPANGKSSANWMVVTNHSVRIVGRDGGSERRVTLSGATVNESHALPPRSHAQ